MEFSTKVEIQKYPFEITHKDRLFVTGSCFAEHIGSLLIKDKFNTEINPFGILYNPQSIANALNILLNSNYLSEKDIFEYNGLYHSFYHHSSFSHIDQTQCLSQINEKIKEARQNLIKTNILIITFGTAYVYHHKTLNQTVGNCHKLPAHMFDRYQLQIETIITEWYNLIDKLQLLNPNLKIIFTVSPIRHLRDGAHDNQLSKSILLLAIDRLTKTKHETYYFPSYEIILDELRDYRFYKEDMIHPSEIAIKYVYNKFSEAFFNKNTSILIAEWQKIKSALDHRPLNDKSNQFQNFLQQTLLKIEDFTRKYPHICCFSETKKLKEKLDR